MADLVVSCVETLLAPVSNLQREICKVFVEAGCVVCTYVGSLAFSLRRRRAVDLRMYVWLR
ncbi:hypothetical protein EJ03DRAFT_66463 [Teratosphaeria nubilosa]|uniref:Uncharacterized protein n=1 Tax=Teratosphaeria nubilosa TaxID=161662 RepID=A0A6G1LDW5_9PEZI|nr:hypothetical protein EJ03DRAFT_66463 [Teratosphaeria nubilosa]